MTNHFAALTLGEDLTHKAGEEHGAHGEALSLSELIGRVYRRLSGRRSTSVPVTKIGKWLGWQNQFSDIYVSNPPSTAKKNDLILTTGLNFTFTH